MRAARVLDMLLTLQQRGRMTARELAGRLEVSERTILRDVEALGEAGVPIVTFRGVEGGIELLDGFEIRLTGLTSHEASALFLAGSPQVARELGLGAAARTARAKLIEALSPGLRPEADALEQWFVHDSDPWPGHRIPAGELRRIASCIGRRRVVELTIGDGPVMVARPLGLVLKAGSWYPVTNGSGTVESVGIDDLRSTRITRRTFDRPPGFSLPEFWAEYVSSIQP